MLPSLNKFRNMDQKIDLSIDHSTTNDESDVNQQVDVVLRNLKHHLLDYIRDSSLVFGCVAWLSDDDIIFQMGGKGLGVVVQRDSFNESLIRSYSLIPCPRLQLNQSKLSEIVFDFNDESDPIVVNQLMNQRLGEVRCIGYPLNQLNQSALNTGVPLMHHKFLISSSNFSIIGSELRVKVDAVWTGSFNFTTNGNRSLENAVILKQAKVLRAYVGEFINLFFSCSEALTEATQLFQLSHKMKKRTRV